MTVNQLIRKPKEPRKKKIRIKALRGAPHKSGECLNAFKRTPRKPNSATRSIARILITSTKQRVFCFIPGQDHDLKSHAAVLISGRGCRDLPGVRYRLIRGKLGMSRVYSRRRARSKYGTKRLKWRV